MGYLPLENLVGRVGLIFFMYIGSGRSYGKSLRAFWPGDPLNKKPPASLPGFCIAEIALDSLVNHCTEGKVVSPL